MRQFGQGVGGIGGAGGPVIHLARLALLMVDTQAQTPVAGDLDEVLDGDRTGHVAVLLVRRACRLVDMPVVLVVQRQVQLMAVEMTADQFHRRTVGLVVVDAARTVQGRVAGILEHIDTVLVLVRVQAKLQGQLIVQVGGAEEVQAFLVPVGPLPVAGALAAAGIDGVAFLPLLLAVGESVFIAVVGRETDLQRTLPVGAIGILPTVAGIGGFWLVVGETAAQGETVGVQVRSAQLEVPQALVGAQVGGDLAFTAGGGADAHIALQLPRGLAGDQVDRAAHDVRAIEQRSGALGHADLGKVEGGEAGEIHIAVIGHVLGNTVQEQRHLAGIEAADIDDVLIAAVVGEVDPRQCVDRAADRVAIERAHGLLAYHLLTGRTRALAADHHAAQLEDAIRRQGFGQRENSHARHRATQPGTANDARQTESGWRQRTWVLHDLLLV
ncbi:hypothetical protein D3C76_809560 [compost metagenome]